MVRAHRGTWHALGEDGRCQPAGRAPSRWQVVPYVSGKSAGTLAPMIHCRFTNAGQLAEEARIVLPRGRGEITIYGRKTCSFADRAACRIVAP